MLAPTPDRNRDSAAETIIKQDFVKVAIPESILFLNADGHAVSANVVTVFQKQMQAGETLEIGKWGVMVFGDQVREPLLSGPGAVLECADADSRISWFRKDRKPFTDRGYRVIAPPEPLGKALMLQASIKEGTVTCRHDGVVYVVTPSPDHGGASQAPRLLSLGFVKTDIAEFQLFGAVERDICAVYQKQMQVSEVFELGNWSVVLLPADGAIRFADSAAFADLSLAPAAAIRTAQGQAAALVVGAQLFNDREHTLATLPGELAGCSFLQSGMDRLEFSCAAPGMAYVITPLNRVDSAESLHGDLALAGFERTKVPVFQAFGDTPTTLCAVYQKSLAAGETFRMRKWGVLAVPGTLNLRIVTPPAATAWPDNRGEVLYNGIRLPEEWPPRSLDAKNTAPMPVPYLKHPPAVIPVDVGRQLFVDDFLVAETTLTRTCHRAVKYEGNPILFPETKLEGVGDRQVEPLAGPKDGGVWWDPVQECFRMWYEAGWLHHVAYAVSKDGLHWERPELDVVPGTNQILPDTVRPDSWNVVPDPDAADPAQRFKMLLREPGDEHAGAKAYALTSPDGIHWSAPVVAGLCGDRTSMFYNAFRKAWVYSLRSGMPGRGRSRHYCEHRDFMAGARWLSGDPVFWTAADDLDPADPAVGDKAQLYNLDAIAYESLMLGMFEIHLGPKNEICEEGKFPKTTELMLGFSRDGFHWSRPDRTAFIAAGRDKGTWDRGYVQPAGGICLVRGDRLWFYYIGFSGTAPAADGVPQRSGIYTQGATGVAFLRRDGFVSMDATAQPGTLLIRPVMFSGRLLFVNVDCPKGELRVEVLDEQDRVIEPFSAANCAPVTVDRTLQAVNWTGATDLSAVAGKPVRFRFHLTNGKLYAFWVSPDTSGASRGFVAAGGPGYGGLVDTVGRPALDVGIASEPATRP